MALINCPECGKEISDKALTCPNCGTPINMRMAIPVTFVRPKALTGGMIKNICICRFAEGRSSRKW